MQAQEQLTQQIIPAPEVTAGLYFSQVALDSERLVLPEEASRQRVETILPQAETVVAVGMAALPESAKHNQLASLVYGGMTSEQYAARHADFLDQWTSQVRAQNLLTEIEEIHRKQDDKEEGAERTSSKRSKRAPVGAKKRVLSYA